MTQIEFDEEMKRLNSEQMKEKKALTDALEVLNTQARAVEDEIQQRRLILHNLQDGKAKILRQIKDINIKYHDMKHSLCVTHPKDTME